MARLSRVPLNFGDGPRDRRAAVTLSLPTLGARDDATAEREVLRPFQQGRLGRLRERRHSDGAGHRAAQAPGRCSPNVCTTPSTAATTPLSRMDGARPGPTCLMGTAISLCSRVYFSDVIGEKLLPDDRMHDLLLGFPARTAGPRARARVSIGIEVTYRDQEHPEVAYLGQQPVQGGLIGERAGDERFLPRRW